MKRRPPKRPVKRQTWDCLVELLLYGTDAEWKCARQVVAEGQGAHLIASALQRRRLLENVHLGSELMRRQLLGEEMAYPEREFLELDVRTGEWRLL
jgi:hypothetical protein